MGLRGPAWYHSSRRPPGEDDAGAGGTEPKGWTATSSTGLQPTDTFPRLLILPAAIRNLRDLPGTRMLLTRERARLKSRILVVERKGSGQAVIEWIQQTFINGASGRKVQRLGVALGIEDRCAG